MSGLQKTSQSASADYDGIQGPADTGYSPYNESPYSSVFFHSPLDGNYSDVVENAHYVTAPNGARSSFSFDEMPPHPHPHQAAPVIISYSPQRGSEGSEVFVSVRSPIDLHSSPRSVFLSFGSKQCDCTINLMRHDGPTFHYMFSCRVPPFVMTMSPSFEVQLHLVITLGSESLPLMLSVGQFAFERLSPTPSSLDASRKRRVASCSDTPSGRPIKRLSAHSMDGELDSEAYSRDESTAPYSPFLQAPSTTSVFPARLSVDHSPRPLDTFPSRCGASRTSLATPSPMTPSWSPAASTSSAFPVSPVPAPEGSSPVGNPPNPTLIRTSTIQQSGAMGQVQNFNPYAMYPTKAVLQLNGDLDSMAEGWTPEEKEAQRRLVQFTRTQNGSTIHADFKPVAPEERAANSICISCIHWEGKDECFVTSVDTIYLLESLVGVRFTVEEKNRIRRNLEGFRPLTVSKAKPDSEEFFKVIMGFPAPKPRNIEKDVKVFPWKILAHALKKIIGKYSASYSSTAGALVTSLSNSHLSSGPSSDIGTDSHQAGSPLSIADSTTSSGQGPLNSAAYSPAMKPIVSSASAGNSPSLSVSIAASSHPVYGSIATNYAYQSTPQLVTPSWDFGTDSDGFDYSNPIPYQMGPGSCGP